MYLVGLVVEGLKGAGVEHPHQVIKGAVVVWDDGEHGLLALPHEAQLHIVPRCDVGDLGQDEGGEADGGLDQNALGRLARGLLENFILPHGDMAGVFVLQGLEQKVQGGLEVVAVLPGPAVLDHIYDGLQVLLLRRGLMEQVEDEGGVQGDLRT